MSEENEGSLDHILFGLDEVNIRCPYGKVGTEDIGILCYYPDYVHNPLFSKQTDSHGQRCVHFITGCRWCRNNTYYRSR